MTDFFQDERGWIRDRIVSRIDSVTEIFTRAGAVRGNHTHNETVQWTYIRTGKMRMVSQVPGQDPVSSVHGPGDMLCDMPGVAHAWEALEDTTVLVFTRGPRSGASYEDDVQRLAPEDRLI